MKNITLITLTCILLSSCNKVPITGRKQMNLLPESEVIAMSLTEYNNFLEANKVLSGTSNAKMVSDVGNKLAKSVEEVLKQSGDTDILQNFKWEFHLVESPEPNAWCMPGGKVVVYTGILPYTKTETGLAVVLGHEVAHAVAKHGNERMSQQILVSTGYTTLDLALANEPNETRELLMVAAGAGATYGVMLPFSRKHESEADRLGLIFMAAAGYDPNEAVAFWTRMSAGGSSVPEFMSTHPSDETRINDIQTKYLPEAMKYYKPGN